VRASVTTHRNGSRVFTNFRIYDTHSRKPQPPSSAFVSTATLWGPRQNVRNENVELRRRRVRTFSTTAVPRTKPPDAETFSDVFTRVWGVRRKREKRTSRFRDNFVRLSRGGDDRLGTGEK